MKIEELEKKIKNNSTDINDHLTLGSLYFDRGDFDKLISLYDVTLKQPINELDRSRIYYEIAEALQLKGEYSEAVKYFTKAIENLKTVEDIWESLYIKTASTYNLFLQALDKSESESKKLSSETVAYCEKIMEMYPEHEDIHYIFSYMADIYQKIENYNKAIYFYKLAQKQAVNDRAIMNYLMGLASVYGEKKKFNKAIKLFQKALAISVENNLNASKLYFDMGETYFEGKFLSDAKKCMRNAIMEKPSDPHLHDNIEFEINILWYLSTITFEMGSHTESINYYSKALKLMDVNHHLYSNIQLCLAHLYRALENCDKADRHYNNVLVAPLVSEEEKEIALKCLSEL